jgi:eukaryotic-like serine/threonine-protein kinase
LGPGHSRLRAWALHGQAAVLSLHHQPATARPLAERAVALKEEVLGRDHPDVGISLMTLGVILQQLGDPKAAVAAADRAIAIFAANGGAEGQWVAFLQNNRGEALLSLKRFIEAGEAFQTASRILAKDVGTDGESRAFPIAGLAQVRLALHDPEGAAGYFEHALRLREGKEKDPVVLADTRFGLARALWEVGRDRPHARALARDARGAYTTPDTRKSREEVDVWLAAHGAR